MSVIKDTGHPAWEGKATGGARCQVQQLMAPTAGHGEAEKAMRLFNLLFHLPSLLFLAEAPPHWMMLCIFKVDIPPN